MKKYILFFLCSAQFMTFTHDGNKIADFLCRKNNRENTSRDTVTHKPPLAVNTQSENSKKKITDGSNPNSIPEGYMINKIATGFTLGIIIAAVGIGLHQTFTI